MMRSIAAKFAYYVIYQTGIRYYRQPDGSVDWDSITLGDMLDRLSR